MFKQILMIGLVVSLAAAAAEAQVRMADPYGGQMLGGVSIKNGKRTYLGPGPGYNKGFQNGFGSGYGAGFGRGYGRGFGRGYGAGYGRGFDHGYGRGYGPGFVYVGGGRARQPSVPIVPGGGAVSPGFGGGNPGFAGGARPGGGLSTGQILRMSDQSRRDHENYMRMLRNL